MDNQFLRVKFLVDQVSGQVAWLKMYPDSIPIPSVDPSLNYYRLEGTYLGVDNLWQEYTRYTLFFNGRFHNKGTGGLFVPDFKRIQLLRIKATAIDRMNGTLNFFYERYGIGQHSGLHTTELMNGDIGDNWAEFFANEYNCSVENARKLLKFKVDEWQTATFMLETTREHFTNKIRRAKTIDEVSSAYDLLCTKLIFATKANLKNLPVITGVGVSPIQEETP